MVMKCDNRGYKPRIPRHDKNKGLIYNAQKLINNLLPKTYDRMTIDVEDNE